MYNLPFLIWLLFGLSFKGGSSARNLEVVKAEKVGIHDVQVVKSNNSVALIQWLKEGGFQYDETDRRSFGEHIQKGWCFVVAKSKLNSEDHTHVSEGLFAPLILRFPSPMPIYPLAVTATGGHNTEVLIYFASDQKYHCNDRLKLKGKKESSRGSDDDKFWSDTGRLINTIFAENTDPIDFFFYRDIDYAYLSRFKGELTPEQMKEDLVFVPAEK